MSVIVEISIDGEEFELGRVMDLSGETTVELESLVPAGGAAVPFFWVYETDFDVFEATVDEDPSVETLVQIDRYDDRALYKLAWSAEEDAVFLGVSNVEAYVLTATGTAGRWRFEIRFPSHDSLSRFREFCHDAGVDFEVLRVYNPDGPDLGPWFGLTDRQREAITLAVERGYYDIPRGCTTVELAEELDISDQAVTERLRRAIATLVSTTLATSPDR